MQHSVHLPLLLEVFEFLHVSSELLWMDRRRSCLGRTNEYLCFSAIDLEGRLLLSPGSCLCR
jgi:hypothetical protein